MMEAQFSGTLCNSVEEEADTWSWILNVNTKIVTGGNRKSGNQLFHIRDTQIN